MALYIIGIGLSDPEDISVKGLNRIKKCDKVYLENYTSQLNCDVKELEAFYGKDITPAGRAFTETKIGVILQEAKETNVAFLVIGAPFSATTHIDLFLQAKEDLLDVEVIENASVLTAVGVTGLFLYKFGRTTTIPLEHEHVTSPSEVLQENLKSKLHTLLLLDITPSKLMTAREGLDYLIKQGLNKDAIVVACGGLGSEKQEIRVGPAAEVKVKALPQCIIVPAELHFKEEEALKLYTV